MPKRLPRWLVIVLVVIGLVFVFLAGRAGPAKHIKRLTEEIRVKEERIFNLQERVGDLKSHLDSLGYQRALQKKYIELLEGIEKRGQKP